MSFGKEASKPRSPLHKGSFWSTVQVNPASIPGSGVFHSDIDILQRKGPRHHTHIMDSDRFSTCSSTSEQTIHTTQSNGVRAELHPFSKPSENLCYWVYLTNLWLYSAFQLLNNQLFFLAFIIFFFLHQPMVDSYTCSSTGCLKMQL